MKISYAIQPQQLGTAHVLRQARDLADDRFLIVAGIYAFNREVFDFLDDQVDIGYPKNDRQGLRYPCPGNGRDLVGCGVSMGYLEVKQLLSRISPSLGGNIEDGAVIKGAVSIGDGIRSNCYIVGLAVIGNNVLIGPGSFIQNSIVAPGAIISPLVAVKL